MAAEGGIKAGALRNPLPQALITLRNLLVRCRYGEIEQIPLLPSPLQVICMLLLDSVRRKPGACEPITLNDDLPIHPVYTRFLIMTRWHASLLWQLFSLGRPVPLRSLQNCIEEKELETMREGGILRIEGENLLSRYLVTSASGLFLLSTFLHRTEGAHVFIAGESSIFAGELQERLKRCEEGLDIGTGSGIQAFALSRFCRRVTGVDINAKALGTARSNALLNGITNTEFIHSDLYRSLKKYDVIVSNPPYVFLTKDRACDQWAYGGEEYGTSIPTAILEGMEEHLNDRGNLFMITMAPVVQGKDYLLSQIEKRFSKRSYAFSYKILSVTHNLPQPDLCRHHGVTACNFVIVQAEKGRPYSLSVMKPSLLDKVTRALKNPRLTLFQILQYLHLKRLKKKKAREEQLYHRALRQLEEKNFERSEYNFNRVLTLNGAHQMARYYLGTLMREQGRQEEAEVLFREIVMAKGDMAPPLVSTL